MSFNISKKSLKFWIPSAVVIAVVIGLAANPLRYSEERIQARLLSEIPLGTQKEKVEAFIKSEGWKVTYDSDRSGFLDQRVRPNRVVGSKSIRVEMGNYFSLPFKTYVTVFWGFNEQSELIDIWVWKTVDAL